MRDQGRESVEASSGSAERGQRFVIHLWFVTHRRPGHGKTLGLSLLAIVIQKARQMLRRILHSDAFRAPQFAAAALLLAYLLQCVWVVRVQMLNGSSPDSDQALRIYQGLEQWKGGAIAGTPESLRSEAATGIPSGGREGHLRVRDGYDQDRSPLYYLVAASPLLLRPVLSRLKSWLPDSLGRLAAATPYLFFGGMLGASLWYVARRLYGNAGGYIALGLYCFSPAMIANVAGAQSLGEMGAVWGAFGTIFTAIAVAHTLYAPREVVLWNWRRIFLLGLSLALAAGNQFSLGVLALLILPLMFWVAPVRPRSVAVIWVTAIAVAATLVFAAYFFDPALFRQGLLHARWIDFNPAALVTLITYRSALQWVFSGCPPLMLALPVALIAFLGWKRARYFGNTIPLLIAVLALTLSVAAPSFPGQGFHLIVLVFLFVFVAGVFADLLETRQSSFVTAALGGLLSAAAIWNVLRLVRL
jgi:hypothetical protein